jgi:hypothetical protein
VRKIVRERDRERERESSLLDGGAAKIFSCFEVS